MPRRALFGRLSPHISKTVFLRGFLLVLIAAAVPALVATTLLARLSFRNTLARVRQTAEVLLEEEGRILAHRVDELDTLVSQLISDPGVIRYLTDQFATFSRVQTLMDVFKFVTLLRQSHSEVVQAIYLFDGTHDTVLADTLYRRADYPDREILDAADTPAVYALPPSDGPGSRYVRYVRRFSVYQGVPDVHVVLDLKPEGLFADLGYAQAPYPVVFGVYTDGGGLVYTSSPHLGLEAPSAGLRVARAAGELLWIGEERYFATSAALPRLGWRLVELQTVGSLFQSSRLAAGVLAAVLAVVVLLSLGAAYLLTGQIYRPLARLVTSMDIEGGGHQDEYGVIREVLARLRRENRDLGTKLSVAYPYLRDHSLPDLMSGRDPPATGFRDVLTLLGVSFRYTRYALAIVDYGHLAYGGEVEAELGGVLARHLAGVEYVVSRDGDSTALVTLNTDADDLVAAVREIHGHLTRDGREVTIAVSPICGSLEELRGRYAEVRRALSDTFFTGRGGVVVADSGRPTPLPVVFDRAQEELVIRCLRQGEPAATLDAFARVIRDLATRNPSIEAVRYSCVQLLSDALGALKDLGIDASGQGLSAIDFHAAIRDAESLDELTKRVRGFLEALLGLRQAAAHSTRSRTVAGAVRFLQENYHREIDLGQVGEAVYLNPRYLARLFKAETGRTVFEYLTTLRMEVAAAQLEDTLKVKEIARSVGYGSLQSFLRQFKKHYGMTPVEYRRCRYAVKGAS